MPKRAFPPNMDARNFVLGSIYKATKEITGYTPDYFDWIREHKHAVFPDISIGIIQEHTLFLVLDHGHIQDNRVVPDFVKVLNLTNRETSWIVSEELDVCQLWQEA